MRLREMCPLGGDREGGEGWTLFDVCSGKGFTAMMLAHAFPQARVIMIDSDEVMDIRHVRGLPNVSFLPLDLFATETIEIIETEASACVAEEGGWVCAFGMHLCGALSPRLLSIFGAVSVDALVLSPCCLKGYLGKQCAARAKLLKKDPYEAPRAHTDPTSTLTLTLNLTPTPDSNQTLRLA